VHEQRDHRELHFACTDLASEILRSAAYHLPRDEHANDQEQQQIDHADTLATEHAIDPHANERRQARKWIQAVVLGIDRTARHIGRDRGERRTRRGTKAQFLAFQVPEMLFDGQRGHRGYRERAVCAGQLIAARNRMRGERGIGLERVPINCPANQADHPRQHHAVDHYGVPQPGKHSSVHEHECEREDHHAE